MPARLEIGLKRDLADAEGASIRRKAKDYFNIDTEDIRVIRVLTIDAALDTAQLERLRTGIFTNPVTEESSFSPMARAFDWLIWVGFRPGVRDTAGSTAVEAVEDLLKTKFGPHEAVYTSKLYVINGGLSKDQAQKIAREILATITTIILQGMTGRLSLGSNHDLAQSLREFPQSKTTRSLFVVLTLSSITFGCAAYEAGNIIGGSLGLEAVTSVSNKVWVAVISFTAVFILGLGKYKFVEKLLIFLVFLMSVSFLTTLIIIKPDLLSLLKGMAPSFPKN